MNFPDYCSQLSSSDGQKVSINSTFVISFSNKTGKIFTIDPSVAIDFIRFLDQSYIKCHDAWEGTPSRREDYTQYEEKSYRAIFQAVINETGLAAISTLGGSQTLYLTRMLSKLICYLGGFEYFDVKINTYFDHDSVKKALSAVPNDLAELADTKPSQGLINLGKRFKSWMRYNKLSEKTITSYSEVSVNYANQCIKVFDAGFTGIFSISNPIILDELTQKLDSMSEWNEKNVRGNGMYRAAINKYREFLGSLNSTIIIPKPFLLLAGISGTGKTRFVREQAAAHCNGDLSNYCLIPVRPDWHEPSDLLGYISRIGQDGSRYVVTDLLCFVVKVWQDAIESATAEELVCKAPADMTPYWLCLDEMNLAPVELYFADYLSILETRKWQDGRYRCDPLLKSDTIEQLDSAGQQALRADLKLDNVLFDGLWEHFVNVGIPLPPNLIVAGTVNMDETTHGFSRKVIDRAFTVDFGVFYPNDFADYFEPCTRHKTLDFPVLSQVTKVDLDTVIADKDGAISIAFLNAINTVLKGTPFELAYRALNELLLAVVCFNPKNEAELQAVWDDFLMSKVLPRIDGDAEKLSMVGEADNKSDVLSALLVVIETALKDILTNPRIDLLRENKDGTTLPIPCRAKQKLKWMKARLDLNGFTTFWP